MDSQDILQSAARLRDAVGELDWRMDWLILDPTAVSAAELRSVAVEIRLACMCHATVLTELMASLDHVGGSAGTEAASIHAWMQRMFDSLVHLRLQVDRFEMTANALALWTAHRELAANAEGLIDLETKLYATYSGVLFPAESPQ